MFGGCLQNPVHLTVIIQADRNLHVFFSFDWMVSNQSIQRDRPKDRELCPRTVFLCCPALPAETIIYDVIENDISWQHNEFGIVG